MADFLTKTAEVADAKRFVGEQRQTADHVLDRRSRSECDRDASNAEAGDHRCHGPTQIGAGLDHDKDDDRYTDDAD